MELGFGVLALSPLVFWGMTPRELNALLRGRFGSRGAGGAPSRDELDELMQRFPDTRTE